MQQNIIIPELLEFDIFKPFSNLLHFVTTRFSPVDNGNDFNIGYSGDSIYKIIHNRLSLAKVLDLKPENFVFQNQVHGVNVTIVDKNNAGAGFYSKDDAIQNNDILITNKPGLCLITRSADCTPILMFSPDKNVIAAIHSGREGCKQKACIVAIQAMIENFGCDINNIKVAIGPAICSNCYQVDKPCADDYLTREYFSSDIVVELPNQKFSINMKKTIVSDLLHEGINVNNIEHCDLCTKHDEPLFFSARNGNNQRFCAGIMLKDI
ncbi:MAG: polyphenol oxidase family protein [Bacteroidales bacterium]|nr:polyphenol oxidase family protein [Bacteroidales bacterium]